MTDTLDVAMLHRPPRQQEQSLLSIDFLVNGLSLFSATKAEQRDLLGCFTSVAVAGTNESLAKIFTGELPAELPDNRIGLFVCPLCGDLGCGAITFQLTSHGDSVTWSRFAYENSWDEAITNFAPYSAIGPWMVREPN
jgi:hypothetical protein